MLVVVFVVVAVSFLCGLWLGRRGVQDAWRMHARAGVRLWYLGLVYPIGADGTGPEPGDLDAMRRRRRHGRALLGPPEKLGPPPPPR